MKNERFQAKGRLLNDILSGERGSLGESEKAIAVAAFRRARLNRRLRGYSGLALIVVAAVSAVLHYAPIERPATIAVKTSEPQPEAVPGINNPVSKLTDEELVASFPSNSCFLAEVDGRQVLVFTDPSLKEKFLHRPAGSSGQTSF